MDLEDQQNDVIQRTIFVGGLNENVGQEDVYNLFITFGIIKTIEIPNDIKTGKPKGFAFIEFEELDDAEQAIDNYDEAEAFGRIIHVKKAKQQKIRQNKAIWESEAWQQSQIEKVQEIIKDEGKDSDSD